jgi:hypothetical protein
MVVAINEIIETADARQAVRWYAHNWNFEQFPFECCESQAVIPLSRFRIDDSFVLVGDLPFQNPVARRNARKPAGGVDG